MACPCPGPRRRLDRKPEHSAGLLKDNADFVILPDRFSVEPFGIGVRQGDSSLRDAVNFALQAMWTSGEYATLYKKWFGVEPETPIEVWP